MMPVAVYESRHRKQNPWEFFKGHPFARGRQTRSATRSGRQAMIGFDPRDLRSGPTREVHGRNPLYDKFKPNIRSSDKRQNTLIAARGRR